MSRSLKGYLASLPPLEDAGVRDIKGASRGGHTPQSLDKLFDVAHGAKGNPRAPFRARAIVACRHSSSAEPVEDGDMEPNLDFSVIGQRIKLLREERKENQVDVAVAIGVARPMVTQYEKGTKKPGRDKLLAIARHFGIPLNQLLYGEVRPGTVRPEDSQEERMLLLARNVPPEVRAAVMTMLEHAAEAPGEPFQKMK